MSSSGLICIAALTIAMLAAVANAATAQTATAADQSGKPYLAGLRPPHEHHNAAHLRTSKLDAEKPRPKSAKLKSKAHRPVRLADKINSRVAWPKVEPADERTSSETVLQFATEDAGSTPAPVSAPRPMIAAAPASPPQAVAPAKSAATDERHSDVLAVDTTATTTATTPVQTERFETPPSGQMRVIMPAPNAETIAAPAPKDEPAPRSDTSMAQLLTTLAGAITAGIVGWLMIGFGPFGTIRSRQT